MKKLPKFLHLANTKAAEGREFILHTGRPAWLAEVFKFDSEEQIIEFGKAITEKAYDRAFLTFFVPGMVSQAITKKADEPGAPILVASRSRKPWNGKHYFFLVIAFYENFENTQAEADRVARTARRMSDWYMYNVLNQ